MSLTRVRELSIIIITYLVETRYLVFTPMPGVSGPGCRVDALSLEPRRCGLCVNRW